MYFLYEPWLDVYCTIQTSFTYLKLPAAHLGTILLMTGSEKTWLCSADRSEHSHTSCSSHECCREEKGQEHGAAGNCFSFDARTFSSFLPSSPSISFLFLLSPLVPPPPLWPLTRPPSLTVPSPPPSASLTFLKLSCLPASAPLLLRHLPVAPTCSSLTPALMTACCSLVEEVVG